MDLISTVIDEIALEGLAGITLPTLWTRLLLHQNFDFNDEKVRYFVWENIIIYEIKQKNTFNLYKLPEPRAPFKYYNRNEYVNQNTGTIVEDPTIIPQDIYGEVCPVNDGVVLGSCHDYKQRIDLTHEIIKKNSNLSSWFKSFDTEEYVVVADQNQRKKALMGTTVDPFIELTPNHYAILERIGRQRHLGEITTGSEAGHYKMNAKSLFHYRKLLLSKKLIYKKPCCCLNIKSQQTTGGSIFYLARFYIDTLSVYQIHAKRICDFLNEQPDKELDYEELKEKINLKTKTFKTILQNFNSNFAVVAKSELDEAKKTKVKRIVKLIKNVEDETNENENDFDEDDEDESGCGKNKFGLLFEPGKIFVDRPLLSQALAIIESHPNGIRQSELRKALSVTKLDARSLVRHLERTGDISSIMGDFGRQKALLYISRNKIDDKQNIIDEARRNLNQSTGKETAGFLKRANLILEYINKVQIVDKLYELRNLIRQSESDQQYKIDIKTVTSLITKLTNEGHVKSYRSILKYKYIVKKVHFICVPTIQPDHPIIKEKIEQAKLALIKHIDEESNKKQEQAESSPSSLSSSTSLLPSNSYVYQPGISTRYGIQPKMKKLLLFYKFLFHLTHDTSKANDWRKNIDPLPEANVADKKCDVGSLVPRLPLSIFVKIITVNYVIPDLEDYLKDERKANLTISKLPLSIQKGLLHRRKYIFSICELLTSLSYLKLVRMQNLNNIRKENIVVEVLNQTSFMDLTEMKTYTMTTMEDVERFASELQFHCYHECKNCSLDHRLFAHNSRNWQNTEPRIKFKGLKINLKEEEFDKDKNKTKSKRKNTLSSPTMSKKQRLSKSVQDSQGKDGQKEEKREKSKEKPEKEKSKKKGLSLKNKLEKKNKKLSDRIDLRAVKLLKKHAQRSEWTSEEDAFLLVCKIASTLLDPNCPNYICVSKTVIRDELHKYYPNLSLDKTGAACLRRLSYMIKYLPQTRQTINNWVGELTLDEQLQLDLQDKRPDVPRTHEDEWKEAFVKTLHYILNKMQTPNTNNASVKANSLKELFEKYTITTSATNILPAKKPIAEEIRNVVDIHINMVTNVLLSNLLTKTYSTDETDKYNPLLFKIYQRYPDSLIRSVVAKMNKCGIITKIKKTNIVVSMKSQGLSPYRISKNYMFQLQTKYCLENIIRNIGLNERIQIEDYKTGDSAAMVTNLLSSRIASFHTEIPENIVSLDDRCPLANKMRSNIANPNDPKCSSRYALHIIRQQMDALPTDRTQHTQDYLVVNQCKVSCFTIGSLSFPQEKFQNELEKQKVMVMVKPNEDSNFSSDLIEMIKSKHEIGVSCDEIISQCNGSWPEDEINDLVQKNLIFRVGTCTFKWVHEKYINPWLIQTPISDETHDNQSEERNNSRSGFFARFWKRPDGTLDNNVLFKYLSCVLAQIMLFPNIPQQKLIENFNRILQPTQLLEIIELLVAADCVEIILLEEVQKPRLFDTMSQPSPYYVSYYEATPNAFINLCKIKTLLNV